MAFIIKIIIKTLRTVCYYLISNQQPRLIKKIQFTILNISIHILMSNPLQQSFNSLPSKTQNLQKPKISSKLNSSRLILTPKTRFKQYLIKIKSLHSYIIITFRLPQAWRASGCSTFLFLSMNPFKSTMIGSRSPPALLLSSSLCLFFFWEVLLGVYF